MRHNGGRFRLLIFTLILIVVSIICLFLSEECSNNDDSTTEEVEVQLQPKAMNTEYIEGSKPKVVSTVHVVKEEETSKWTDEEAYLLSKMAMAEAEGEDVMGKALVICVILNRVQSTQFPSTIYDVIYEPGQFTPIYDGRFNSVEPNEDCIRALQLVESCEVSTDALYYESTSCTSTWHSQNLSLIFTHGGHKFYK